MRISIGLVRFFLQTWNAYHVAGFIASSGEDEDCFWAGRAAATFELSASSTRLASIEPEGNRFRGGLSDGCWDSNGRCDGDGSNEGEDGDGLHLDDCCSSERLGIGD